MAEAVAATPPLRRTVTEIAGGRRFPSDARLSVVLFVLLLCWSVFAGKDVGWDLLNHQLYLPFSWATGRFRTDLFGAGPQSYQNPFGYFPLYWLVRAGLPAWLVGVVLSSVHALVVWPVYRIARVFWPMQTEEDFWLRTLAVVLCLVTPVLLIHVGTTSTDALTAVPVVWAIALSIERADASARGGWQRAAIVGLCLGVASGIKLSNAVFALPLCLLWLVKWGAGQASWRQIGAAALALTFAFAISAGPWMLWLWQEFGNPIFPLYNDVFQSPYAPQQPLMMVRFMPRSAWAPLTELWQLCTLASYVSFEGFLPDIRPLLAALAVAATLGVAAANGGARRLARSATWRSPGIQLAIAMIPMYLLWLRSTGNARYGIPLFLLVGIVLVRAVQRVLPRRTVKIVLLTALLLQSAYFLIASEYRFAAARWDSGAYVDYKVPARLRDEPFLHVSIGTQSNATAALFLDPRGALTNPIGLFSLPTDGPLGARFEALLKQWQGRTRLLFAAPDGTTPTELEHTRASMHTLLYRLGLDVDWSDCEHIELVLDQGDVHPVIGRPGIRLKRDMLSCRAIQAPTRDPAIERQHVAADKVFALLEAACPKAFTPTPMASEYGPDVWQRHYMNTEVELSVSTKDGVFFTHFRSINGGYYGTIDDVLQHRQAIRCPQVSYQTPM